MKTGHRTVAWVRYSSCIELPSFNALHWPVTKCLSEDEWSNAHIPYMHKPEIRPVPRPSSNGLVWQASWLRVAGIDMHELRLVAFFRINKYEPRTRSAEAVNMSMYWTPPKSALRIFTCRYSVTHCCIIEIGRKLRRASLLACVVSSPIGMIVVANMNLLSTCRRIALACSVT
jgi:hypothetical protein